MYKDYYLKATQAADMIRQGTYKPKATPVADVRQSLMAPSQAAPEPEAAPMDDFDFIASLVAGLKEDSEVYKSELAPEESVRPRPYEEGGESATRMEQAVSLTEDPEFMDKLDEMKAKYDLTESEVFNIIRGESGFNPKAQNKNSKAAGLFQFIPATAKSLGTTTGAILKMTPAEQLEVYDRYLTQYDYRGEGLGIIQAAPALRHKDQDEIIYAKGTKAWEQNPGWRDAEGNITRRSINNYYQRQRS